MELDARGIPTNYGDAPYAPACPPVPCQLCTGDSAVRTTDNSRLLTSWEWCQQMKTCAATVDWDRIAEG